MNIFADLSPEKKNNNYKALINEYYIGLTTICQVKKIIEMVEARFFVVHIKLLLLIDGSI